MGILKLENVGYRYKDAPKDSYVFKNINYEFEQGKMYAIRGKSGSGKATLLSLIKYHIIDGCKSSKSKE